MTKIILDCDPGHDDAVALLLALGNPGIDLLGVTTVGGNQTLDKVTRNAQVVLELTGHTEVPVYPGCDRPLVRDVEIAADIHGSTGMDVRGIELPEPSVEVQDSPRWISSSRPSCPTSLARSPSCRRAR